MTPDALEKLISAGSTTALIAGLSPLDESARRKLSKSAAAVLQKLQEPIKSPTGQVLSWPRDRPDYFCAKLAVLGCCELGKVKRLELGFKCDPRQYAEILNARKPAWIDSWIEHRIAKHSDWQLWTLIRRCVRAGVATRPESARYVELMVYGINWAPDNTPHVPLSQRLLADPALLQHEIWQLFQIESAAFETDHYGVHAQRPEGYETWTLALIHLASEGHIDRSKLVNAALASLTSGLRQQTLNQFARFAEALDLSVSELKQREETLCQLTSNTIGSVVSFGIAGLARLEAEKQLNRALALDALEPALQFPKKTQASAALALLKNIAKRDAALRPTTLRVVAAALRHHDPTVQGAAIGILEIYSQAFDETHQAVLRESRSFVAPTLQERLDRLCGPKADTASPPADTADADDLQHRIEALPPYLAQQWGLTDTSGTACWGRVTAQEQDYKLLEALPTVDAVLEAIALAVESVSGADDAEQILDGIARFSDRAPRSEVAQTILKRFQAPTSSKGLSSSMGLPPTFRATVGAWLGVRLDLGSGSSDIDGWWTVRFNPYLEAALRQTAWQPLSSPTHVGGWVDPRVWVERLRRHSAATNESDGIQSLLRLAPFGRPEALAAAASLDGRWKRIAVYALGGDERPGLSDVLQRALWLAAARARQPKGTVESVSIFTGYGDIPDALRESRFDLKPYGAEKKRYESHKPDVTLLPLDKGFEGDVRSAARQIPQCAQYPRSARRSFYLEWFTPWVVDWKSYTWPQNPRGFLYWGINQLLQRFDASSSSYEPNYMVIETLKPLWRELGDIEHLALAAACMTGEQESRRSAAEVILMAGLDGRFDPGYFSAALRLLYGKGWCSMGRLASTLQPAAKDSPQASRRITEALSQFLASLSELPHGAHGVVELLYQEYFRLGIGVPESLRPLLGSNQGSTKTGKLCEGLLVLQGDHSREQNVNSEAARKRFECAKAQL